LPCAAGRGVIRSWPNLRFVNRTSFNVRGEPIVCTPEDAFRCFMGTELDLLAIGNAILLKTDQQKSLATKGYQDAYELD
jgi:carbamoyltransferase